MTIRKTLAALALGTSLPFTAAAGSLVGGDAPNQAAATSILDIVFAIDTSGSMADDAAGITAAAQNVIRNLNCPDTDCYVRARFFGISGTWGASSLFNENAYTHVDGRNGALSPLASSTEDNGPVVNDLVSYYEWNNDATATQSYYRAIVTIGDEGTQNGSPVAADDWAAAYSANQAAAAAGIFLFSWVVDPVTAAVPNLFQKMATGGTETVGSTTYNFTNTGGGFVTGSSSSFNVEAALEAIICDAASGGGGNTPEPGSLALAGLALSGLALSMRRKSRV